jgi:hypothetical protein
MLNAALRMVDEGRPMKIVTLLVAFATIVTMSLAVADRRGSVATQRQQRGDRR